MKQDITNIKVGANGRMILPLKVRKALGVTGEGVVVVSMDGNDVKLSSIRESMAHAQKLYRDNVKVDETTEDFLKERRAETAHEEAEDGVVPQWQK